MQRKLIRTCASAILAFCLIIVCFQVGLNRNTLVSAADPSKLKIFVGPPKVLADNNVYEAIFVQLQDSKSLPARATEDLSIHLSSSLTYVGSVDPTITIPAGSTYAVAKFYSTYTPGSTTITAAATGYASVQASLTTVGPVPSKLAVYAYPSTLPADGKSYDAIVVQLQDAGGVPARAPIGDVAITLSSSDTSIGNVKSVVTILAGTTYVKSVFNTTTIVGTVTITAISPGYASGQATVKTQVASTAPEKLKVYLNPAKISAEGNIYDSVVVQLLDASNGVAVTSGNVMVELTSSNTAVGTVATPLTIPSGSNYAIADFHSTFMSGSATITAVATDYTSSQATITTVGPIPTKLGVYCVPSSLPGDGKTYEAIVVQLQDSRGTPAKDPIGDINIELFSSKPEVGDVDSSVSIPYGKTFAVASFFSKYDTGATSITAITPGYTSGTGNFAVSLIDVYDLEVTATANPAPVSSGKDTTIRVYVTYSGLGPVPGATVTLSSDKAGNFSTITDEKNGYYMTIFRAPIVNTETLCTIRVNASKIGYGSGEGTLELTINPSGETGHVNIIISDIEGTPIGGANVTSIMQPTGILPLHGVSDEDGALTFTNILAGSYTLEIEKAGYEAANLSITAVANQTKNYTINLPQIDGGLTEALLDPTTIAIIIAIITTIIVTITVIVIIRKRRRIQIPKNLKNAQPP